MRDGRRCSGVNTECRFHMRIRRGVSCTLCPPVPWLPVVTTPVLPPPPAVLWRLEVRGREVYCDAARYAHICIPVEPDSGTYVFINHNTMAPLRRPASHTTQTLLKSASYILSPLHSASALLPLLLHRNPLPHASPPPHSIPHTYPLTPPAYHIHATSTSLHVFTVCVAAWLMGVVCQTASCCSKRIAKLE